MSTPTEINLGVFLEEESFQYNSELFPVNALLTKVTATDTGSSGLLHCADFHNSTE